MKEQLTYFIKANISNPIDEEIDAILDIFQIRHYKKHSFVASNSLRNNDVIHGPQPVNRSLWGPAEGGDELGHRLNCVINNSYKTDSK
ncbi:MAG: hypothetical protein AAFZ63_08640 [Bacteroidota bacterium]